MNVRRGRESKRSHGDRHGGVRRCYKTRVTQAKVFVTYMNRECDDGGEEGRQSPGDNHLIGRGPTGERTECEADDKVHHTYEYHRSEPRSATRSIHACGPAIEFTGRGRISFKLQSHEPV